ncbi:hypothetical protein P9386_13960 [Caldifermentibacillus hisashii]|uniref:hypothetical protein n=1 Tax=Caldifermentibacillus hisashii TaxID=996558 RepID=UPI002E23F1F9|nr:hypothetical protein [Caldifermentibacillus hisashii]
MATSLNLVANLRLEMLNFDDEACSRHQFGSKMLNFDDEACSRHRFRLRKLLFWRRAPFSSPFFGEKSSFLTTNPILVIVFG